MDLGVDVAVVRWSSRFRAALGLMEKISSSESSKLSSDCDLSSNSSSLVLSVYLFDFPGSFFDFETVVDLDWFEVVDLSDLVVELSYRDGFCFRLLGLLVVE